MCFGESNSVVSFFALRPLNLMCTASVEQEQRQLPVQEHLLLRRVQQEDQLRQGVRHF